MTEPVETAGATPADRAILHVDIDAFFASVEQIRHPKLRGLPVIVGNGVIASCSYEARRFGLHAGMRLSEARRLCPEVVILDGHEKVYRAFAGRVFDICRRFAPTVECYLDEAYADLSGTRKLYGGNRRTAAGALKEAVRQEVGVNVTLGLGTSRMVAKMAGKSVKPDGFRVIQPGAEEAFITGLSIDKLPGVGHATGRVLRALNVQTIGDLRALPLDQLVRLFGVNGRALFERCRGRDTQPVCAREIPHSISRETSFHHDTIDPREIEGMLGYLTERAVRTARQLGLKARTVAVRARAADQPEGRGGERDGGQASRTLPHPSDRDEEIFHVALDLLYGVYGRAGNDRRQALHAVGVTLSHFVADSLGQLDLFDPERGVRLDRFYQSLDRVRDRFGHSAVVTGASIHLLGKVEQDGYGFVLRTPSLTK